jgi:hypothetical protein
MLKKGKLNYDQSEYIVGTLAESVPVLSISLRRSNLTFREE